MSNRNHFKTSLVAAMATTLFTLLTAGLPVLAQDDGTTTRTSLENIEPERLSDLNTHVNALIGNTGFNYSGNSTSKAKLSGGITAEFGEEMRRLETGFLVLQIGGQTTLSNGRSVNINSTLLTIPLMAKIRIAELAHQSWYLKGGMLTAFEMSSSHDSATNNIDVLATLGAGGRFQFMKNADFIIEATFNRGFMDAVRTSRSTTDYNQGFIGLAGISFRM